MATKTSLLQNNAKKIWSQFMPRRNSIKHKKNTSFLSIQVYPKGLDMADFTPQTEFITRAGIEVTNLSLIPEGMDSFIIPQGLYAIFEHQGATRDFHKTSKYIYEEWLPTSGYVLDDRPHFEVLDERYLGPDHPDSIEDVYIPIL